MLQFSTTHVFDFDGEAPVPERAAQQYALENKLSSSSTYTMANLNNYVKLTSAGALPGCPANGTYSPGATVANPPTCSESTAASPHKLP